MGQPLRLLMVEDSEDDAELLRRELTRGGYAVTTERVETADAMRTALERRPWDIVTSDHAMPRFSAPAALALLKEVRPDLPFVIVSNEIDLNLAVSLMKAGAQDYIQKRELAQIVPALQRELREVEARRRRREAEAALRDSEKRYRDLVESLPEAVFEVDLQGRLVFVNRPACELFGYTEADFAQGLNIFQMLAPEEQARARANFGRLVQTEPGATAPYLALRKDGRTFPAEITSVVIRQDQQPVGVRGVVKDITARQQAETALREELDLFIAGPVILIRWRPGSTWPVIYVSPNVQTHLGYRPEDLTSGRLVYADLIHPDDRARALSTGEAFDTSQREWHEQDYRLRRADGQYRWIHDFTRIVRAPDGLPAAYYGYITDVTANRQAAAELDRRQQELAAIGRLASAIASSLDLAEVLDQALRGVLDLTGLDGGAVCLAQPGQPTLALASARNLPPALWANLNAGEVKIGECLCTEESQNGLAFVLWDSASGSAYASQAAWRREGVGFHAAFPLSVKNRTIGVLCLFAHGEAQPAPHSLDLARQLCGPIALAIDNAQLYEQMHDHATDLEQRVVERTVQLAAINQELEAFSYSVAHDLRVPLRTIDGYSQALLEDCADKLGPEERHHLERIRAATQRMRRLIDDLLELSRLTRGDLDWVPLDLSALAQAIAAELRRRAPERSAEFVIAPGITARADARLMRATLENLLDNAWKFTANTPIARIEFGELRQTRDGQEERIYYVRDNGAGFHMDQVNKLFQTFQRLHSQDEFPGTGIGLATVKRIIHRHGGRVWAEGAEGHGATFYFTL